MQYDEISKTYFTFETNEKRDKAFEWIEKCYNNEVKICDLG